MKYTVSITYNYEVEADDESEAIRVAKFRHVQRASSNCDEVEVHSHRDDCGWDMK